MTVILILELMRSPVILLGSGGRRGAICSMLMPRAGLRYFVGCNNLGMFPFPTYDTHYPNAGAPSASYTQLAEWLRVKGCHKGRDGFQQILSEPV